MGILCGWALVATLASCFPEAEHEEGFLEVTGAAAKGSAAGVCAPGEQQSCGCADGRYGTATCEHDGSGFGGCACPLPAAATDEPTCGDDRCDPHEDCEECAADCGVCPICDLAPACSASLAAPTNPVHAASLDIPAMQLVTPEALGQRLRDAVDSGGASRRGEHALVEPLREVLQQRPQAAASLRAGLARAGVSDGSGHRVERSKPGRLPAYDEPLDGVFPGGSAACGLPLLRLAASKIEVHQEEDNFAKDIVYCVLQAQGEDHAEVRVTPKTPKLDAGDSHAFPPHAATFWGQLQPVAPKADLELVYDCIESDDSDDYADLIAALRATVMAVSGTVEGQQGWILNSGAKIAPLVVAALALGSDDHLFSAWHALPLGQQLALANGAYWTVRRSGDHLASDWDWELTVKAWGCAEGGTL
jgi:hypothetical protein